MTERGEVLVAIVNNHQDFAIIQDKHWYRIPVHSANKWLANRWPPQWIAFYQTKIFGEEAYSVNYYAPVIEIGKVNRRAMFPDETDAPKAEREYYQLMLGNIKRLPEPIYSRRWRRIVFIPTTWKKFVSAVEINDLWDESPLEDRLWGEMKRHNIPAERQVYVSVKQLSYFLDFTVYCAKGNIDIEADGDTWHAYPEKAAEDNFRDNALEAVGWKVLRFSTPQINEQAAEYCIETVSNTINHLGGVDEGKYVSRKIDLNANGALQLGIFDE